MSEFTLIVLASVSFTALLVNRLQIHFIRRQFSKPFAGLSEELSSVWAKSRLWKFANSHAVVGSSFGVNTGQALYHLSQIDPRVLESIDAIYDPSQVNSYHQILSHLSSKRDSSATVWEGAIANYKGRVGEEFLAEHLRAAGHIVIFAESTSQEGWDAIVDGQKVNFKAGLGTNHIQDHLNRFPDIPVITVAEHAEAFSTNPQVTCLEGVSGHEIAELTQRTMESATSIGDFEFELPLITMAVASVKNFTPFFEGYSDIGTALKHTAADTAGVGIGAAAGAKAGAMIGAFGGPFGAAAGAIIGGLGGAIGGKWIAKNFKEKNLREAILAYEQRVAEYGRLYIQGLSSKAQALEYARAMMVRPLSLIRFIAPTPGDILRKDIRIAYKRWADYCRWLATQLQRQVTSKGESAPNYFKLGQIILREKVEEPVYSPSIQKCIAKIIEAVKQVRSEQLKLGYK